MEKIILVINPGSTSTKIAVYRDEQLMFEDKVNHTVTDLQAFTSVYDQKDFRTSTILSLLEKRSFDMHQLDAICGRGGVLAPIKSGTYRVNDRMINHLKDVKRVEHASNLGAIIARELAEPLNIPAFVIDPVTVDELLPIARISGMKAIPRTSIFHALNHKAIARRVAKDRGVAYHDLKLIIAHLGGGISVGVHHNGQVIDVNNALNGEGPMAPERSGSVPVGPLTELSYSHHYTLNQLKRMNYGEGGLVSYLGTNNAQEIVARIHAGDEEAKLVYDAMIYQVAKEIGALATVLHGEVDAIVLTAGLAYEPYLVHELTKRVSFISDVLVYPGEDECLALALGTLRVLNGEEEAKEY